MPNFSMADVNGKQVSLSDLKDKVVLFDFWSTTCGPCVALTPKINALYEELKSSNRFVVVGVSDDKEKLLAVNYFKNNKLEWINLYDGYRNPDGLFKQFGVFGKPQWHN